MQLFSMNRHFNGPSNKDLNTNPSLETLPLDTIHFVEMLFRDGSQKEHQAATIKGQLLSPLPEPGTKETLTYFKVQQINVSVEQIPINEVLMFAHYFGFSESFVTKVWSQLNFREALPIEIHVDFGEDSADWPVMEFDWAAKYGKSEFQWDPRGNGHCSIPKVNLPPGLISVTKTSDRGMRLTCSMGRQKTNTPQKIEHAPADAEARRLTQLLDESRAKIALLEQTNTDQAKIIERFQRMLQSIYMRLDEIEANSRNESSLRSSISSLNQQIKRLL